VLNFFGITIEDILKNFLVTKKVSRTGQLSNEIIFLDLKDHPTGLTLADKNLWTEHAAQIGKLHTVKVDNIDKGIFVYFLKAMFFDNRKF